MTSKLPVRKNIEPLYEIASELESHLEKSLKTKNEKNELIYKTFTDNLSVKNVTNKESDSEKVDDKKFKRNFKLRLQEKDEQIEKLVERLQILHTNNEQFAAENDQLKSKECDLCKELLNNENRLRESTLLLRKENDELRDDVRMMKTLIYRLNVQLERHQDELRKCTDQQEQNYPKINFDSSDEQHLHWGSVKAHTLGPLLNAYSEIIKEKNSLVQQYENDLNHFTGKLKDVVAENDQLQTELKASKQDNEVWASDKTRLQAQLDLFRNKAEVQSKRADITKEKLVEVLKCYEQKFQSQNLDLERLQEAYSRAKGELTALRGVQQCPSEVLAESLKEMQKLFQELSSQYDSEKTKLNSTIESLTNSLRDVETKCSQANNENDTLKKHAKSLEEQNDELLNKNTQLRESLARVRLSRESFKSRLKNANSLHRTMEGSQRRVKNTWSDLKQVETLLQQKENHVQSVHLKYLGEIEKLTRKLQQRDDTLKKVLRSTAAPRSRERKAT
ncbi:protein Cep89 homolog isoform X1 [Bradysia coprophila]|uniref:protein Cep89 homolog isoform X1 n=1 Tax=Bradysia coprophila TaxID=38358 RepID=UPI00187D7110|nr:protein Cep89 homolog isoform X1 [Bradysia coprophila]